MTDNEIIKALECCGIYGDYHCDKDCPNMNNGIRSASICRRDLIISSLALINRQKAEIERLTGEIYKAFVEKTKADMLKACERQLAIYEFAERLKKKGRTVTTGHGVVGTVVDDWDIDNLVKEMVGEAE